MNHNVGTWCTHLRKLSSQNYNCILSQRKIQLSCTLCFLIRARIQLPGLVSGNLHKQTHTLSPSLPLFLYLFLFLPPSFPPLTFRACFANSLYVMIHNTAWEISPWKEITAFDVWLFPVQSSDCTWLMCVHVWGGVSIPWNHNVRFHIVWDQHLFRTNHVPLFSPNHLPCWPLLVI